MDPVPGDEGTEIMVVGSCQGWHVIDARHAGDYYLPFGVASAVGGLLSILCWLIAGE